MAEIIKRFRRRSGARKLDLTPLQKALRDRRVWVSLGIVEADEGRDSHIEKIYDGSTLVDILIDVTLQPEEISIPCRLSGAAGSYGLSMVPVVGTEVMVVLPAGRYDFMPTIMDILSTGEIAEPSGQGPAEARIVIMGNEIFAHDGTGGAVALALKSDVDENNDRLVDHVHPSGMGPTGMTTTVVGPMTGTSIFKAK